MEVQINIFLQQFSNNFLDKLNLLITNIGDEIFFLVVAMVVFWCVDKRFGFKLINVYLLGCIVMSAMKNIVRRPRPFEETRVQSIGERESGYSFPSGHSHSIANLSTQAVMKTKKNLGDTAWRRFDAGGNVYAAISRAALPYRCNSRLRTWYYHSDNIRSHL